MPTRMLKDSVAISRSLMAVSAEAFRLWAVLLTQTDDYGMFHADPHIILGRCFPLLMDKIDASDVQNWMIELVDVQLVQVYEVKGKWYVRFIDFFEHNSPKALRSKWPGPDGKRLHKETYKSVVTSWDEFRNLPEPSGTFWNMSPYPYPNPYPNPGEDARKENLTTNTSSTGDNGADSTKPSTDDGLGGRKDDWKRLIDHYGVLCEGTTGIKPAVYYGGQYERVSKMILERCTLTDGKMALERYFRTKDKEVVRKAYPFPWVPQRLPELLGKKRGQDHETRTTEELIEDGAPVSTAE